MADTPGVLIVKDGSAPPVARNMGIEIDPAGNYYMQHVPRVDGAPVGQAAPMPVANAAVGTTADAPWSGTGVGTIISILKAIWVSLNRSTPLADRSGVIALGGMPQQLMAANSSRKGWSFQNKSAVDMWFNDLGGAADPTANNTTWIPAGSVYESEPGGTSVTTISIFSSSTGAQFSAREW